MAKTHFILVGFGDLGTRIFPTLMQINDEESKKLTAEQNLLDISIVDFPPVEEILEKVKPKLERRFESFSEIQYEESKHLDFLRNNYFQDSRDSKLIPEDLITRIRPDRTIVYLAIPPDGYLSALKKYLPFANIFAIEKPLATDSEKAGELVDFARKNFEFFGKRFIPVDHYLGKYSVNLLNRITKLPKLGAII